MIEAGEISFHSRLRLTHTPQTDFSNWMLRTTFAMRPRASSSTSRISSCFFSRSISAVEVLLMLWSSNSPTPSRLRSNSTQPVGHPDVAVVPDDAAHAAGQIHEVLVQPLDQNAGHRHQNAAGQLRSSHTRAAYLAVFGRTRVEIALALAVDLLHFGLHEMTSAERTLITSFGMKIERIWRTSESFRRRCSPPGRSTELMLRLAF